MFKKFIALFIVIFNNVLSVTTSWVITCALIKLICLCFSYPFILVRATGIWLSMILIRSMFITNKTKK